MNKRPDSFALASTAGREYLTANERTAWYDSAMAISSNCLTPSTWSDLTASHNLRNSLKFCPSIKTCNVCHYNKCIKENSSNVYVLTSYKTKVENNDEEDDDEDKIPNGLDAL